MAGAAAATTTVAVTVPSCVIIAPVVPPFDAVPLSAIIEGRAAGTCA